MGSWNSPKIKKYILSAWFANHDAGCPGKTKIVILHRMELIRELGKRLSRQAVDESTESRFAYSYDASKRSALPITVIHAASAEDVIAAVQVARAGKLPLVPRGAGSGLTG